ncbi:MAG: magnesium transporter [Chloroflexi bacterium]|nr:magnesium transporter [Chloroflexota bacterium]
MRLRPTFADVRRVRAMLVNGNAAAAGEIAAALAPTELADLLIILAPNDLSRVEPYLGTERIADAVAQMDPSEAARLLVRVSRAEAADILEEMEPDDATDVVEELRRSEAEGILAEMRTVDAQEIRDLLAYPPHTAGGRMTPDVVAVSPSVTVAAAMRLIRAHASKAETIYTIYVTDTRGHLLGVLSLRDLVLADPHQRIGDIMRRQVIRVPAEADQEEAARLLMEHDLLAIPVVDDHARLMGVVTADDLADVLEEEATEDIERLGGSEPLREPYLTASLPQLFRKRVVWLGALLVAGTATSAVLQGFSATLGQVVSLAFFVPLLIGTGGNVGSQIVTTVVRALAVGDVVLTDVWRVLRRELLLGLTIGLVMAVALFFRAETMGVEVGVALAVAVAAIFIVVWSAIVAAMLPLVLHRLRTDPAVVSAPLLTTLVDATGLLMYLTIARLILGI